MWERIVNLAIQNGLFAVLFLGLLIYLLKDSAKREKKYQQTIEKLNDNLQTALQLEEDVKEIKQIVNKTRVKRTKNVEM